MKGNSGKCHFTTSTAETHQISVGDSSIRSRNCDKLLRFTIVSKLTFDDHVKDIWKKANKKIRALAIYESWKEWMLLSLRHNNIVKHLHQRCLRLIYHEKSSSYDELWPKDSSVSIHYRNVQNLSLKCLMICQLKLLLISFCSKHKLITICDIIMTLKLPQYHLCITNSKVFYFLDLGYRILSPTSKQ